LNRDNVRDEDMHDLQTMNERAKEELNWFWKLAPEDFAFGCV